MTKDTVVAEDVRPRQAPARHRIGSTEASGGAIFTELTMMLSGKTTDITTIWKVTATPKVSEDEALRRLVGQTYIEAVTFACPPMLDCGMTAAGAAGCRTS